MRTAECFLNFEMISYWRVTASKVLKDLGVGESGLSEEQAKRRLKRYGPNKIPRQKRLSLIKLFLSQFKSPFTIILGISGAFSLVLGHSSDFFIICAALSVGVVVGFLQEYKASKALAKLRTMIRPHTNVRRSAELTEIEAQNIVPGDIVILEVGDKIPADGRIISAKSLEVNEAPLTGESKPSLKRKEVMEDDVSLADRANMVYAGTTVARGKGEFVVTVTGGETELGKIAGMVRDLREEETPLQKSLSRLGKTVAIGLTAASGFVFLLGVIKGQPLAELLMTSVALAVASVPEGLPATLTVVLALGMQRLSKKGGLVRSLKAAETLGSASVICMDKTGTLTEGKLAVERVDFEDERKGKLSAVLCNDGKSHIDKALLEAFEGDVTAEEFEETATVPFTSKRKYMAVAVQRVGELEGQQASKKEKEVQADKLYIKGAPEVILSRCDLSSQEKKSVEKKVNHWAEEGFRVLGFAYKETNQQGSSQEELIKNTDGGFTFLGLVGFTDPLRAEAKDAVEKCKSAGIRIVIVTGDHKLTALNVAKKAGLSVKENNILEGAELANLSDEELQGKVNEIGIFARVEPSHKVRILHAFRANGEVVAMTGDGMNDAPALKAADIGVALGSGTDVAKETADLVLTNDNFGTIVAAVEQGRVVFENIQEVALYLLSDSFQEILLVGVSILLGWPLPLLPAQILWINFVEDGFPGVALAFDPGEEEVMNRPPREKHAPILDRGMKILILLIGLIDDVCFLGLFWLLLRSGYNLLMVRSFVFTVFSLNSLFYVFSCAALHNSVFHYNIFSNLLLLGAVIGGTLSVLAALYFPPLQGLLHVSPLPLKLWGLVALVVVLNFLLIEFSKLHFIVKKREK